MSQLSFFIIMQRGDPRCNILRPCSFASLPFDKFAKFEVIELKNIRFINQNDNIL